LLSVYPLLGSIELQEDPTRNRGQDRYHNQQLDERESTLVVVPAIETLFHFYVPRPTTV
jgi:hypothetical protein